MAAFSLTFLFLLIIFRHESKGSLMYPPEATSLGLVASVSIPITEYFPERRMLFDWCLTLGYNLPSSLSQFYNIPIWPGVPGKKHKRQLPASLNETHSALFEKYENPDLKQKRHYTDFTAGELYQSIEDFLVSYGFHETCLLRAVCELACHPFDDRHQNFVTDIVTFFLTPTLHEGFDETEQLYREVYEKAEEQGFYGENCEQLYSDCQKDILSIITQVILLNK